MLDWRIKGGSLIDIHLEIMVQQRQVVCTLDGEREEEKCLPKGGRSADVRGKNGRFV